MPSNQYINQAQASIIIIIIIIIIENFDSLPALSLKGVTAGGVFTHTDGMGAHKNFCREGQGKCDRVGSEGGLGPSPAENV